MVTVRITGAREIERAFKELPPRLAKKVIRQALRAGAKIVRADAQGKAPADTGTTRKAIKVRAGKARKKNVITMAVILGQGDYRGETFYGAFQNYGWKTGKRGSANRRQIAGKRFMDRALGEKREQARAAIAEVIARGIDREVMALARGSASGPAGPAKPHAAGGAAPAPATAKATGARPGRDDRGRFISAKG